MDRCHPEQGCQRTAHTDGTACNDFLACTQAEQCQQGRCVGAAADESPAGVIGELHLFGAPGSSVVGLTDQRLLFVDVPVMEGSMKVTVVDSQVGTLVPRTVTLLPAVSRLAWVISLDAHLVALQAGEHVSVMTVDDDGVVAVVGTVPAFCGELPARHPETRVLYCSRGTLGVLDLRLPEAPVLHTRQYDFLRLALLSVDHATAFVDPWRGLLHVIAVQGMATFSLADPAEPVLVAESEGIRGTLAFNANHTFRLPSYQSGTLDILDPATLELRQEIDLGLQGFLAFVDVTDMRLTLQRRWPGVPGDAVYGQTELLNFSLEGGLVLLHSQQTLASRAFGPSVARAVGGMLVVESLPYERTMNSPRIYGGEPGALRELMGRRQGGAGQLVAEGADVRALDVHSSTRVGLSNPEAPVVSSRGWMPGPSRMALVGSQAVPLWYTSTRRPRLISDATNPANPTELGSLGEEFETSRLATFGALLVVLQSPESVPKVALYDVTIPGVAPQLLGSVTLPVNPPATLSASAIAADADHARLVVSFFDGHAGTSVVVIVDAGDPSTPRVLASTGMEGRAAAASISGDQVVLLQHVPSAGIGNYQSNLVVFRVLPDLSLVESGSMAHGGHLVHAILPGVVAVADATQLRFIDVRAAPVELGALSFDQPPLSVLVHGEHLVVGTNSSVHIVRPPCITPGF